MRSPSGSLILLREPLSFSILIHWRQGVCLSCVIPLGLCYVDDCQGVPGMSAIIYVRYGTNNTLQAVPDLLRGKTQSEAIAAFLQPPIGSLVAATISTFGIYFIASFLYVCPSFMRTYHLLNLPQRDPWHMFSSFLQYLCIAPSFTNVLNVYAFCNLHDVSWGTKGSDKADVIPSVSSKKDGDTAVVEDKAAVQADVDAAFKDTVTRALKKDNKVEVVEKPTLDDQNKTFRTRLVSVWMITNGALVIAIQQNNSFSNNAAAEEQHLEEKQRLYFTIILYSTFVLSLVRFIGVSTFLDIDCHRVAELPIHSVSTTFSGATCSDASAAPDLSLQPSSHFIFSLVCGGNLMDFCIFSYHPHFHSSIIP